MMRIAVLGALSLTLSLAGTASSDEDADGPGKRPEKKGSGREKQAICHVPPGNPGNAHTLYLPDPAVKAHLRHGDKMGPCSAPGAEAKGGQVGSDAEDAEPQDRKRSRSDDYE